MFKPEYIGGKRIEAKFRRTKILASFLLVLLAILAVLILCDPSRGAEIPDKTKLSLRGKVVTEQFADTRDQRCFETLQSCQNSLAKLALSFRPVSEREAALSAQVEQLKVQNDYYLKMIDCWQKNRKDTVKQDTCLSTLKQ